MGRWACTVEEAAQAFVPEDSPARAAIWDDWWRLATALRQALGEVAACWISGSFCTDKPQPNDIDCVWIVDSDRWSAALNAGNPYLTALLLTVAHAGGNVKGAYGLKVDSYVLEWMPSPGVQRIVSTKPYLENRGYWDNLWVRCRDSDQRLESVPRRGYLEVIIDGYR